MKLALSEISTPNATFAEDVVAYAAAGFDAIGIWEFKLPPDDEANRALLREHGLAVATCIPTVPSLLQLGIPGLEGPADPEERTEALCASVRRLAAYAPECVLCITGPRGALGAAETRDTVVEGLRRVAAAAAGASVRLGLEPIHASQHDTVSFVNTVAGALALLEEAGLPDVGVMVDTYNLAEEDPAAIAAIAGRVTGLHVADHPGRPVGNERLLPTTGTGRTRDLVVALRSGSWDGFLDVEIFSTPDAFWALPPDEAARRAHAAAAALRDAL